MPVFTIQTLVDRAAAIADMHDQFVKPTEWLSWYNTERRALQLFMARFGSAAQNLQMTSALSPDLVTITNEILAVVGVWEVTSSGRNRQLKVVPFVDGFKQLDASVVGASNITGPSQIVSIEDTNTSSSSSTIFRFFPRATSGSYLIVTAQAPSIATSMSDTTSLPMGLEERIVLGMARRALVKEESDTRDISNLIRDMDVMVEEYIWSRSLAQAPAVRNVDDVQRGWGALDSLYPHPDSWTWL